MIVPMRKVYIVVRRSDREQLLALLRELGVVHLVPVDPRRAVPDETTRRQIDAIKQSLQILAGMEPQGAAPQISPSEAAQEVLDIQRRAAEGRNRLATLYHQLEQIAVWDDLRLEDVAELRRAGVKVEFYAVPAGMADRIEAECVTVVGTLPGRNEMVAVAHRGGEVALPEEAERMRLPQRDAHSIRAEAKELDEVLHRDVRRLHELARLVPAMETELLRLEQQAEETVAVRGAAEDDALFAVQGWLPEESVETLQNRLSERGIPAGLEIMQPEENEQPPTLVRLPRWARPIEGMFNILGTVPGYREFDISIPFLIALPIFTAMLISDGGYGALLLLVPALMYSRATEQLGKQFTHLLMVVGAVSLVWGTLTNAFFGVPLLPVTLIPVEISDASRIFMMRLSFLIGGIHLSLAQLWQCVRYFPDLRWLNKLGWALFIWGMYGVVSMFVLQTPMHWGTPWPYLLVSGAALSILFASPSRNVLKTIGLGLADFPLSMISAFSDVISYVRLMAVGLASSVLAVSFNQMAFDIGFLPLTILILVFGHGLNIGLGVIAMFAHGVRLNMLEFSNNLGMEWVGYPYRPFAQRIR